MTFHEIDHGREIYRGWSAPAVPSIGWWLGALVVGLCATAGLLSVAMGPDNNWDLRYYHLYAPWAYLHGRYLYDIAPAESQSFLNPTADLLFYSLVSSWLNESPRLIAFIMGAIHGINAALIVGIAFHLIRPLHYGERSLLRAAAILMGASGAGVISLLGTTTNDLVNSIFVLAALLCLLRVADPVGERRPWSPLAWPGALLGVAVGLKYTAAIFAPGLGLIALFIAVRRKTLGGLIAFVGASGLAFVLVAGHHLATLWHSFGNPVFPLFNDLLDSTYHDAASIDTRFAAHDLGRLLGFPFYWMKTNVYLVSELPLRDWRGGIAYLMTAAALSLCFSQLLRRAPARLPRIAETRGLALVSAFVAVSYLVWAAVFGIYRYAVVLEMLTGVLTMASLIYLCKQRRLRVMTALGVLAVVMTTTVYPDWGHGAHPSAGIRPAAYGERYVDVRVPPLPPHSLVLIATEAPVAYFIPYAEPTARYLGIDNSFLRLSQRNELVTNIRRLVRAPGTEKFVLGVDDPNGEKLHRLLATFGLQRSTAPCQRIRSNLEEHALSLCPLAP
jgi:Glycosyltransferase family 87